MGRNKIFTPDVGYDKANYTIGGMVPLKVFIGGTIDCGSSDDWQKELVNLLEPTETVHPLVMYNPRRDEWPDQDNKEEIRNQIKWELHHLEQSDVIVMNIIGNSKSPISLMELGLFARDKKLVVFCPQEYYRFENVSEVCERYEVPVYMTNDVNFIATKVLELAQDKNYKIRMVKD